MRLTFEDRGLKGAKSSADLSIEADLEQIERHEPCGKGATLPNVKVVALVAIQSSTCCK